MTPGDVARALEVDPSDQDTIDRFVRGRELARTWHGAEWEVSTADFMAIVMSAARVIFSQPNADAIAPKAPLMIKIADLIRDSEMSRWTIYRALNERGIRRNGKHGVMVEEFRTKWPAMYARLVNKSIRQPLCIDCGTAMQSTCAVCDKAESFQGLLERFQK